MKNPATLALAAFLLIFASSCGSGNTESVTVDSLSTDNMAADSMKPADTVYPQTDTNSFRKDTDTLKK